MVVSNKIIEMKMNELIMQLGIPEGIENIRAAYKFNASSARIMEFEEKLKNTTGEFYSLMNVFCEYEDIFDKEIYVFHVAKLLEKDVAIEEKATFLGMKYKTLIKKSPNNQRHNSSILATAKNFLSTSDVADLSIDKDTKSLVVDLSQVYIGNGDVIKRRDIRSEKKVNKVDEVVGLTTVLRVLYPSDLIDFCRYPNLGNILAINLYKGTKNKKKEPELKDQNTKNRTYYWSEFKRAIRENAKYIDFDRMLLLYVYLSYKNMLNDNLTLSDVNNLKRLVDKINELLDNSCIAMNSLRYDGDISFPRLRKDIDGLNSKFIDGTYYSEGKIDDIIEKIESGKELISNYSTKIIAEFLKSKNENIDRICLSNVANLKFLNENGFLKESDIKRLSKANLPIEILAYLFSIEKIDAKTIEKNCLEDLISRDDIMTFRKYLTEDGISELVSEAKLLDLYFKDNESEDYRKYLEFYKAFRIDGRDLNYRMEIGNRILELADKRLNKNEHIKLCYEGIVPFELIAQENDSDIMSMLTKSIIRPSEIRELYKQDIITLETFFEIIRGKRLNDYVKMSLMFSTFSSEEDSETRNKLLDYYFQYSRLQLDKNVKINKFENTDVKLHPATIWQEMSNIDYDYKQQVLDDGNILFYLPSKNQYIIKRIYNGKKEFTYGSATYLIDGTAFEKIEGKIIRNNKVVCKEMEKAVSSNEVTKLISTGWKNSLDEYFDNEEIELYTEDQKNKIYDILQSIKK